MMTSRCLRELGAIRLGVRVEKASAKDSTGQEERDGEGGLAWRQGGHWKDEGVGSHLISAHTAMRGSIKDGGSVWQLCL